MVQETNFACFYYFSAFGRLLSDSETSERFDPAADCWAIRRPLPADCGRPWCIRCDSGESRHCSVLSICSFQTLLLIMLLDGARKDATCQTLSLSMTLSDSLAQSSNVAACVACIHDDNFECGIWTMILYH